MLYQCKLIKNGFIKENLIREGDSAISVLEVLRSFQFGSGTWVILLHNEIEISGDA